MTDNDQFSVGGSQEFSDETIRRFLLGGLTASERPLFEQRFITDDGLNARVRLAELDLADDYAFERLSAADRKLFEQRFLSASSHHHQLKVSEALRARLSLNPATALELRPERNTVSERLRYLLGLDRPAWRIAFAVLILVILFGAVWLVIKEPRITQQITNRLIPRRSTSGGAPREASHPVNASKLEHQTTPSPMPEHDQTASSRIAASIVLMPDVSSESDRAPSVHLPKGEKDIVRLQLVLKSNQPAPYRAELLTVQGQSVFSVDSLPSADSRAQVDFDIPAHLLNAGDYQIRLSRSDRGSKENVASYYFRLQ